MTMYECFLTLSALGAYIVAILFCANFLSKLFDKWCK